MCSEDEQKFGKNTKVSNILTRYMETNFYFLSGNNINTVAVPILVTSLKYIIIYNLFIIFGSYVYFSFVYQPIVSYGNKATLFCYKQLNYVIHGYNYGFKTTFLIHCRGCSTLHFE